MYKSLPSPNFDERTAPVNVLVLHYTGMPTAQMALDRLADPNAKVSAHHVLDEDGTVYAMVAEEKRAWHAGVSHWRGKGGLNDCSVGIEIVNPGHEWGYRPFPDAQIAALIPLCNAILSRHSIPARNVVGHSDIAPARKLDPGELFPWERLAGEGIGLWPVAEAAARGASLRTGDIGEAVEEMQRMLAAYGYSVQTDGVFDAYTEAVVSAFQRHFRPARVDGVWDGESAHLLRHLLAMVAQ